MRAGGNSYNQGRSIKTKRSGSSPSFQSFNLGKLAPQAVIKGKEESHPGFRRTLSQTTSDRITLLPSGGYWFQVGSMVMQIGCPPETIKDSINLGLDVPRCFIVLGDLFSTTLGLNTAELEFPAYFNFFIKRRRTLILTTPEFEERIRKVFQETLMGPLPEHVTTEADFSKCILSIGFKHL